ncbi:S1C family serine protease [Brachybacterium squillarum]|uniref:S1C family serine protease n=1 Tax=Brachybacterium squillarum TaxID=661979 RepID=UPI000262AE93|nr:trypsin-like peptidase domain-containing protein [Brachybacterium squillarum]
MSENHPPQQPHDPQGAPTPPTSPGPHPEPVTEPLGTTGADWYGQGTPAPGAATPYAAAPTPYEASRPAPAEAAPAAPEPAPYAPAPHNAWQPDPAPWSAASAGPAPAEPWGPPPEDTHTSAAAPAAVPTPAAATRRRGPGWGGTVLLVGAGMLLSGSVALGGAVAVDQITDRGTSSASSSTAEDEDEAATASTSIDDPDWSAVAAEVSPSSVAIETVSGMSSSTGTGVIMDAAGNILTNNHVVTGATEVEVTLSDGRSFTAEVVGTDDTTDLAVVRLTDPPEDLQPATVGDSEALAVGEEVMAIGTPLGLENTVTTGIVSALNRPVTTAGEEEDGSEDTYTSAIQTDAAINPGNSGGPLVNAAGEVVGINTAIAGIPGSSETSGSIGLGFAIPASTAWMIGEQLAEDGTADLAYFGVTTQDGEVSSGGVSHAGAAVVSVEGGTPAAEAGLREGDVIVAVDDTPVGSAAALTGVVRGLEVGSEHELTVMAEDGERTVSITPTTASS